MRGGRSDKGRKIFFPETEKREISKRGNLLDSGGRPMGLEPRQVGIIGPINRIKRWKFEKR
jgi:hypothetical protein